MIILTDIHGNFDTMIALLAKIPQEEKSKGIVIADDLIDRGPKSRQIVQWCIDNNISVVKGNHEEMMIDEIREDGSPALIFNGIWAPNGGIQTLYSYKLDSNNENFKNNLDHETLKKHREWMANLSYYLEFKDVKNDKGKHLLITHSSACKVWGWDDERRKTIWKQFVGHVTWGRPNNITPIPNIYNVFGHTPGPTGPKIKSCYANIDTGCFYTVQPGQYGVLTALQFPEMIVYQQKNVDG